MNIRSYIAFALAYFKDSANCVRIRHMTKFPLPTKQIKLTFIEGLHDIVKTELSNLGMAEQYSDHIHSYLDQIEIKKVINLRSVLKAHLVRRAPFLTPKYIAKNKSILGDLIDEIVTCGHDQFSTFKLIGAGTDSPEVRAIAKYIAQTFKLEESQDADFKVHMIKIAGDWEVGVELTSSPLSVRSYKVRNMEGAMNPTIAYAINSLAITPQTKTYLNPFAGSATLLIEAGLAYKQLETLIGFDDDKQTISLAMQNVKQSGLIRKIQLKLHDICEQPDLGLFDAIVADLPFGMSVSKHEDLEVVYGCLVKMAEQYLSKDGIMVLYTAKHELLKGILNESAFKIDQHIDLKLYSTKGLLLQPHIFVCKRNKGDIFVKQ